MYISLIGIGPPVLTQKRFEAIKKENFSGEKNSNSGNNIYDYAHSFFGEDFKSNGIH